MDLRTSASPRRSGSVNSGRGPSAGRPRPVRLIHTARIPALCAPAPGRVRLSLDKLSFNEWPCQLFKTDVCVFIRTLSTCFYFVEMSDFTNCQGGNCTSIMKAMIKNRAPLLEECQSENHKGCRVWASFLTSRCDASQSRGAFKYCEKIAVVEIQGGN